MAPELTGISSSPQSHGLIDTVNRALFGGRLIYFGPTYLGNLLVFNFFNANRCWVVNPWAYSKVACRRLYEATLDLITQVEAELGISSNASAAVSASSDVPSPAQAVIDGGAGLDNSSSSNTGHQPVAAQVMTDSGIGTAGRAGFSDSAAVIGGLKQRQQQATAAAPLGVSDDEVSAIMLAQAEALPALKGA